MPGPGCKKSHRKHTPITSEAQRRLFAAKAYGDKKTKAKSLTKKEAKRHLKEVKGRKLPERA